MSADDPSSWVPNLTPAQFWVERSNFAGILLGAVAYGVHATLFFLTLTLLCARPRTQWKDYGWIVYITLMFVLSSVGNGGQFKFTELSWIDNRNYPGGPGAYETEQAAPSSTMCNIAYIINGWLQDALIIYRFWIIYNRNMYALVGGSILLVGEVVSSLLLFIAITTGGKVLNSDISVKLLTAYFALSIALNILLTLVIVFKLMLVRHRVRMLIESSVQYLSISAMLIESAALYSVAAIIFLVPWVSQNPVQNLVLPTLVQLEGIAPILVIMRVAQGRAWAADTESRLTGTGTTSTLAFSKSSRGDTVALSSMGSTGASITQFKSSGWGPEDEEVGVKVNEDVLRVIE
ncbi:hypothetical protein EXIGLDRAFT_653805 [Exidia glandulosa HHB12029]|uniref:Uncharacterized protein n=1 Tax=Exidia glandulosa HHB12029 TaxID=1314781 RepID=A0A165DZJ5_EXIGL|nr:hypothetical protein EXIGLDRAFT_653805 [Exidia glandulosa HHB12029]